jgi:hypothetical protein
VTHTIARWKSGGVLVEKKLYRATQDNEWIEDITEPMVGGSVEWNADRGAGVKMSAEFSLTDRTIVAHHADWLAPVLTLTWDDGVVEEQQFGLFLADWPEDALMSTWGMSDLQGFDPTWRLWNSVLRDTKNVALGANRIDFVTGLMTEAGWTRYDLPPSSSTFDVARSWFPPERRYDVAAKVLESMGWYHPFADMTGYIRSRPYTDLATAEPVMTITEEDPIGEVKVIPTTTTLANIIVVRKPGIAEDDGLVGIAENADPFHPLSTVNREPIVREIQVQEIQTQAEADEIALEYLREASSYYRVLQITLSPGVWPRPYQVVDVRLHSEVWGCMCGRYHIREWKVGFAPSDNIEIECNRVQEFVHED